MNSNEYIIQDINISPINADYTVCFSIDNNYAKYFSAVLESFIKNSDKTKKYDVVILFNDLSIHNMSKLVSQLSKNVSLRFYNIESVKSQFIGQDRFKPKEYWSESMYFRLLIPEIFKKYEKVLYCDSDIIFNTNIDELFNINTDEKSLLVVLDSVAPELKFDRDRKNFIENYLQINHSSRYFNSGIIVFNLLNINNDKYFKNLIFCLNKFDKLKYPDQDILNVIFQGNVKYISQEWNFQVNIHLYQQKNLSKYDKSFLEDYIKSKKSPRIIHYAGTEKPWHNPSLFFHDKFWRIARQTPFYEEIIYENNDEKLKLLACKDDIYRKYVLTKFLSKLALGNSRKNLKNKRIELKRKVRKIREFLEMGKNIKS